MYWDVRRSYASRRGVIRSSDLRSGSARTEYSGPLGYPIASAAGIGELSRPDEVYVHTDLPHVVAAGLDPHLPLFVATDGTAYAWVMGAHTLGWWTPGRENPVYLHVRQKLDLGHGPSGFVVSGQYVVTDGQVIDMTTAAAAPLAGGGLPTGKFGSFEPLLAGGGILLGTEYTGTGHYVDGYWRDPQPQLQRVDTTALPELRC